MYEDLNLKVEAGEVDQQSVTHQLLENMRKVYKSHRNIAEIERVYINNL